MPSHTANKQVNISAPSLVNFSVNTMWGHFSYSMAREGVMLKYLKADTLSPTSWQLCQSKLEYVVFLLLISH